MDESIKRILKMVEEGKLSSEKAAEMIDVLKSGESTEETTPKAGKKLVIRVKKKTVKTST